MDPESLLLPYRLRTVRTGVLATFFVLTGLAAYSFLPAVGPVDTVAYLVLLAIAAAGGGVIALLPWKQLFERGIGMSFMYAWSVLDILIITAVVGVTGPATSHLFWIYTLTAFFMAATYPPTGQLALLVFTYACYVGLLLFTGSPMLAGDVLVKFTILAVLTFMASFLFRELMRQMTAHDEARGESERRAGLLATVARAGRGMSTLSTDEVLSSVIDSATDLGFDAAVLGVFEDGNRAYRVARAKGMPEGYVNQSHPATHGTAALLLRKRETIIAGDGATNPFVRDQGFTCGIVTPVWVQGEIVAGLAVVSREKRRFTPQEVEAVELLAAQAGRGIENARRFEHEQQEVERMAELDRLKQDFLSTVSHELRTPLTAIQGMGLTLDDRWDLLGEERRRDFLRRLNANADRLHELITSLLDFSRLEGGHVEVQSQPIILGEFLEAAASRLSSLFTPGSLSVVVVGDLVVKADPQLLERVIDNLLSNASKHTPAGTPVELSAYARAGEAVVSVTDKGPGIPDEELIHIGERFYRGGDPNTRETSGTGLGLSFTREVLALHGSRLEIESDVGTGSRFTFSLPLSTHLDGEVEVGTAGSPFRIQQT